MDKGLFGDTAESAWILEFFNRCIKEVGGRLNADIGVGRSMCRSEPKHAQILMQMLAQRIRKGIPNEEDLNETRFALGSLFLSYMGAALYEGWCRPDELPPELEQIMQLNPEINECANEVMKNNFPTD